MAKAFDDETNQLLRQLAREVLRDKCDGKKVKLAELIGVSPGYVSDFLNENRGAGLDMLTGLGKLAPLEFLGMLGIDPGVVVLLASQRGEESEAGLLALPDILRRAARAVIELTGCAPGDAGDAAVAVFEQFGALPHTDADWWCTKIRAYLDARPKSGERPSSRIKSADESTG